MYHQYSKVMLQLNAGRNKFRVTLLISLCILYLQCGKRRTGENGQLVVYVYKLLLLLFIIIVIIIYL